MVYSYTLGMHMHVNVHTTWWIWEIPMWIVCVCVNPMVFILCCKEPQWFGGMIFCDSIREWGVLMIAFLCKWMLRCSIVMEWLCIYWRFYAFLNVIIINYNMEDANVTYVFLTDPFDIADAMIVGLGKKVGFNDCR